MKILRPAMPLLLVIGLTVMFYRIGAHEMSKPFWPEVAATVEPDENDFWGDTLKYRYEIGGRTYRGKSTEMDRIGSNKRMVLENPPDSTIYVKVNPDDPAESFFGRSRWTRGGVLMGCAFMAAMIIITASLFVSSCICMRQQDEDAVAFPVGQVFGLGTAGLAFAVLLLYLLYGNCLELIDALRAQNWEPVRCEMLYGSLRYHENKNGNREVGNSHVVDVLYRYEYGGKTYYGDRYFPSMTYSSYNQERDSRAASWLREGAIDQCLVDPHNPSKSAMRQNSWWAQALWLVVLPFSAAGVWVAWKGFSAISKWRRARRRAEKKKLRREQRESEASGGEACDSETDRKN